MANPLRARMEAGQNTRALWLEGASPTLAEAAVYAGFRFLLIDNEHAPISWDRTLEMVRAIEAAGGHPMVRVAANDVAQLKHLLDMGVTSIMVPRVESADEARAAVAACHYPPLGERGFAGEVRASRYGLTAGYAGKASDELFLMLQIESARGVENAAEIVATPGIHMIFPGPYDLSGSMGYPGQTGHPEVLDAIQAVKTATLAKGLPLGTVPHGAFSPGDLLGGDFSLVIAGSDMGHAANSMRADANSTPPDWL